MGVPGELCIGGLQVARGYVGGPLLTAGRFVPDPYGEAGGRLYRTGDRARLRSDGSLEYLGRLDEQVKVRGFRVEPGEIEARLVQHPGVREAAVLAVEDEPGRERLVAYLVPSGPEPPTLSELHGHLRLTLPDFMVPSAFVGLEALPLTVSGKLDRRRLPAPERARPGLAGAYVGPRTRVEEVLAGICGEVLHLEHVGVHDNFFQLGGHSLLATQVVARVRDALNADLRLRDLFQWPTVEALGARIEESRRTRAGPDLAPIAPRPREGRPPASFAQRRLWFLDRLTPGDPAYNVPTAVRIAGPLRPELVARAMNEVVRRHEALRTTFATADGSPVQVIAPELPLEVPVVDLSGRAPAEREEELTRLAAEEAQTGFDLERGPLLRCRLVRLGDDDHAVLLTMHHVVSDAWSMTVLVRELAELYQALAGGRPARLPELPIQYADYAEWQRERLSDERLRSQLDYWTRELEGVPLVLDLPRDHPRPAVRGSRAGRRSFLLSPELAAELSSLAQREGSTLFMVLMAAFQVLLHRYTGQQRMVVGTPTAGRGRRELEGLIGFFVNTLPICGDLRGDPSFVSLLARVREAALGADAHQELPFEQLVEALRLERDPSRTPIFQVFFDFENIPHRTPASGPLRLSPLAAAEPRAKFDLLLGAELTERGLQGTFEYSAELFEDETIARLVEHFRVLLEGIVRRPEDRVTELALLTPDERRLTLVEWNRTERPRRWRSVVEEIEEQARTRPGAVALECGGRCLRYGELLSLADRVAARLAGCGVGPETRVGLLSDRTPELVIGLLGILRAGAAYVPLEPATPPERLRYITGDAGVHVLAVGQRRLSGLLPGMTEVVVEELAAAGEGWSPPVCVAPEGVAVTHGGLANYLGWAGERYWGGRGEGSLVHTSVGFDLTVTSLLLPLTRGEAVVLVEEGRGMEALEEELSGRREYRLVKLTPAHLELLRGKEADLRVGSLVIGGEQLGWGSVRGWLGRAELYNEYGPTEAVVGCVVKRVEAGERGEGAVPIGVPAANTRVYVLDRSRRSRGGTWGGLRRPPSGTCPTRTASRGRGSTGPETWRGGAGTGSWSTWAARTRS